MNEYLATYTPNPKIPGTLTAKQLEPLIEAELQRLRLGLETDKALGISCHVAYCDQDGDNVKLLDDKKLREDKDLEEYQASPLLDFLKSLNLSNATLEPLSPQNIWTLIKPYEITP